MIRKFSRYTIWPKLRRWTLGEEKPLLPRKKSEDILKIIFNGNLPDICLWRPQVELSFVSLSSQFFFFFFFHVCQVLYLIFSPNLWQNICSQPEMTSVNFVQCKFFGLCFLLLLLLFAAFFHVKTSTSGSNSELHMPRPRQPQRDILLVSTCTKSIIVISTCLPEAEDTVRQVEKAGDDLKKP